MDHSRKPEAFLSPPSDGSTRWWSKDTVAVVTGGNKGIGFAVVKRLAENGLTVILTARDRERGQSAVEALRRQGLCVHFSLLDVSDAASIAAFASWLNHHFGVIDILINNAGVSFNDVHENSVDNAEVVIRTNFYGPKRLVEALLPMFRRSNSKSRILNLSSRLGSMDKLRNPNLRKMVESEEVSEELVESFVSLFLCDVKRGTWKSRGWPQVWTDYAVSKLALNTYTRFLAKRCKKSGIAVNCFCPGFTRTSMTRGKGSRNADDAAAIVATLALLPPEELATGKFYTGYCPLVKSKL